jgi:hypothetical protein
VKHCNVKVKGQKNDNVESVIHIDKHRIGSMILAADGAKTLYLIEPDPSGFKSLASAEMLAEAGTNSEGIAARVGGATQNWAPIALADGKLLIRDQKQMKCIVVK